VSSAAIDIEWLRNAVTLGKDAKGTFVSTNSTSSPFYLLATNLDLPSMIGAKRDTNVISSSRFGLTTQYVPSTKFVNGRLAPGSGYYFLSGRYAVLSGRILTLTDFEMDVSAEEETRGEVLAVHSRSEALQVSAAFAADAARLGNRKAGK